MRIRIYLYEDVSILLSEALGHRGIDVVTTRSVENQGISDVDQLEFAKEQDRVLLTHNIRDFVVIHKRYLQDNLHHSGIIVSDQLPIGTILKRTLKLCSSLDLEMMRDRLEYLSNWK